AAPLFLFALTAQSPPRSTLFPYTTLFRSVSVPARFFGNLGRFLEDTHPVDTFNEHTGDLLMIPGQRQLVRICLPRVWSQPRGEPFQVHFVGDAQLLQRAQRDEPIEALFCEGMQVVSGRAIRQQVNRSAAVTDKTIQVDPAGQAIWDAIRNTGDDLTTVAVTNQGHVAEIVSLNVTDDVLNVGV